MQQLADTPVRKPDSLWNRGCGENILSVAAGTFFQNNSVFLQKYLNIKTIYYDNISKIFRT
jgi:hypothetical protein